MSRSASHQRYSAPDDFLRRKKELGSQLGSLKSASSAANSSKKDEDVPPAVALANARVEAEARRRTETDAAARRQAEAEAAAKGRASVQAEQEARLRAEAEEKARADARLRKGLLIASAAILVVALFVYIFLL